MRARLEYKLNMQALISPRSKSMMYLDKPTIVSLKMTMYVGNEIQKIDASI